MAPQGQVEVQTPHPAQTVSSTPATVFPRSVSSRIAWKGHVETHFRHPTQALVLTLATAGSDSIMSFESRESAFAAAALPWATDAGMSFGPWAAPAR